MIEHKLFLKCHLGFLKAPIQFLNISASTNFNPANYYYSNIFLICAIPDPFYLYFRLFNTFDSKQMFYIKIRR